jgi:uncharacterized protein
VAGGGRMRITVPLRSGRVGMALYGTGRDPAQPAALLGTGVPDPSVRELITTDLAGAAGFLGPTPLLVVHGRTDAYCSPEGAQAVFDVATGPKEILWLDSTNHIDLYDVDRFVDPAVARCAAWFAGHL